MKVVALFSGGKDSVFSIIHCMANGHDVVALANLYPQDESADCADSRMFQSVGHDVVPQIASCLVNPAHENQDEAPELPLFRRQTKCKAVSKELRYTRESGSEDEVEDLYMLLQEVKSKMPDVQAVCSGVSLSNYQRLRVEDVCQRLGLQSLAYLWNTDSSKLLESIICSKLECVMVKVASVGLSETHMGKTLSEMQPHLEAMAKKFDINVCGEGGEYETLTLDAPIFRKRVFLTRTQKVVVHADADAPSAYLKVEKSECIEKPPGGLLYSKLKEEVVKMKPYPATSIQLPVGVPAGEQRSLKAIRTSLKNSLKECKDSTAKITVCGKMFYVTNIFSLNADSAAADAKADAEVVMNALKNLLEANNLTYENLVFVHVYVKNMADFAALNAVYGKYFGFGPAARACVEVSIDSTFQIDALGVIDKSLRRVLHVPSISYWAPANIGPYAQCCTITDNASYVAGQIGFTPETMLLPPDMESQAVLALRHAHKVAQAQQACGDRIPVEEKFISCICYVAELSPSNESLVRTLYPRPMIIVKVPRLPRNALIEWMIVASDELSSQPTCSQEIKFTKVQAKHCARGSLQRCGATASAIAHFSASECENAAEIGALIFEVTAEMNKSAEFKNTCSRLFYDESLGNGFAKLAQDTVPNCAIVPCGALNDGAHVAIVMHYSKA